MEVQATQNKIEEAGDDGGALAATGNAEARKKKSDVVTIPKKAALAMNQRSRNRPDRRPGPRDREPREIGRDCPAHPA